MLKTIVIVYLIILHSNMQAMYTWHIKILAVIEHEELYFVYIVSKFGGHLIDLQYYHGV